ncbi:MAG: type II secretion system F family protein [Clostridia bacterium]|nr:type II secretion system F family protein [Clostridia bacterium]
MQKFKYSAIDRDGHKSCGTYVAHDERELASALLSSGLYLVSAKRVRDSKKSIVGTLAVGVRHTEVASLCRRFAIMQSSFIPLPDSLKLLRDQTESSTLKNALSEVYDDVTSGSFLSEALRKHPAIFPDFMCSMVYVGELGGKLDSVLSSLADYYERDVKIRRKFRSALEYPAIIFVMTVALAVIMLTFIVPTFKETLRELDVEISGLTAAVYSVSDFLLNNWYLLLLGTVLAVLALYLFLKTERGRVTSDLIVLKLPLISRVEKSISASRLARSLGLLISSGMSLSEALSASAVVIGNRHIKKRYIKASENVRR